MDITAHTIIRSRPDELGSVVEIGSGQYTLHLNQAELYLITALICSCRLGGISPYAKATYTLISSIADTIGDDEMSVATDDVNMQVTIEDSGGNVVFESDSGHSVTLEV